MYLVDALKVLLRRWPVVVVGIVALVAAAAAVVHYVPTQYQASGQLLLVLPADATGKKTPTNPYLNQQTGLITVASLTAGSVTTKDEAKALSAEGYKATYAAAVNPGTGPLIVVTAKSADPAEALATRDAVIRHIDADLAQLQQGENVPPTQLITAREVNVASNADVLAGSKIRALTVIAGGIVLLTLMVAFGWEGLANRRRAAAQEGSVARDGRDVGSGVTNVAKLRASTRKPSTSMQRAQNARKAGPSSTKRRNSR